MEKYREERDNFLNRFKDDKGNVFIDHGCYTLMNRLIQEIYVGSFDEKIEEFEKKFGSNEKEYYEKQMQEYDDKRVPVDERPHRNELYEKWRNLARENDYYAISIASSFVEEVEKILSLIQKYSVDIYTSYALERLVQKSFIQQIDKGNKKLADLYEREIKRDLIRYKRKCLVDIDKKIMALRNTSYYKLKKGIGDKAYVGNKLGITFGELYQNIYTLAENKINGNVRFLTPEEEMTHVKETGYFERIINIKKSVEKIDNDNEYKKLYIDSPTTQYTKEEEKKLKEIRNFIQKNINALKEAYERLMKAYNNKLLTVSCIDGLSARINAINDTIKSLKGIVGYDEKHPGQMYILNGTLKMLRDAKVHSSNELDKYKKTNKLLGESLDAVEDIINMINHLESEFDMVIDSVKARVQRKKETENDNKTRLNM